MYFKPHFDILPFAQKFLWNDLAPSKSLGFVLYGGTAVALQLGHRQSVDFDFFTELPLDKKRIFNEFSFMSFATVIQDEVDSLSVIVPIKEDFVKISFFGAITNGRFNDPLQTEDGVLYIAHLEDLLATKLKTVMQRVEVKDYQDISAMLKYGVDIDLALSIATKMYKPEFSPQLALKTISYFEGGDFALLTQEDKNRLQQASSDAFNRDNYYQDISLEKHLLPLKTYG
ncbi:nucleotidyl transferase AbiEii/AbiGii toxin family protein [Pelistega sp. NLN82]|uniref:Nucleotidyl transferase AbiEii/AbiGii toxin family protein n=1 Tax=Pelistega ratti TaxID=2652177 RepID=A0A6L9Y636_9BURK|nr:nucleotidyl transferase AbiEii/AbiGii toxin family protein [Pelistega ratti]NEN75268.1 nucleotidyl transferase AbiEii/AbiGii toxin family protein [Pelistega ratti]